MEQKNIGLNTYVRPRLGVKSCVSENRQSQEVARWKVHRLGLNPLAT